MPYTFPNTAAIHRYMCIVLMYVDVCIIAFALYFTGVLMYKNITQCGTQRMFKTKHFVFIEASLTLKFICDEIKCNYIIVLFRLKSQHTQHVRYSNTSGRNLVVGIMNNIKPQLKFWK